MLWFQWVTDLIAVAKDGSFDSRLWFQLIDRSNPKKDTSTSYNLPIKTFSEIINRTAKNYMRWYGNLSHNDWCSRFVAAKLYHSSPKFHHIQIHIWNAYRISAKKQLRAWLLFPFKLKKEAIQLTKLTQKYALDWRLSSILLLKKIILRFSISWTREIKIKDGVWKWFVCLLTPSEISSEYDFIKFEKWPLHEANR